MQLADFDFTLPRGLIAQYPAKQRSASRLLCLDRQSGDVTHRAFTDLPDLLHPNDLLVFNDTRVIPARLYGEKETGGRVEILVERLLDAQRILAQVRASKAPKIGSLIRLSDKANVEVVGRDEDLFELRFLCTQPVLDVLEAIGHIPLPPYIERQDESLDKERYQTVFAREKGAVAAPTAGLHFDERLLRQLADKGIQQAFITLHVGAGTFQPVRVENIEEHKMHKEFVCILEAVCEQVHATKKNGGRVIAVGTTCVRSLEAASSTGSLQPFHGDTDIFITPGYRFRCVDAMITNFHLPKSTLLMLVSAFAGCDHILNAYQAAIKERYRFFSYGDAMFIS